MGLVFIAGENVRDIISISKLLKKYDGPEEVRKILTTLEEKKELEKERRNERARMHVLRVYDATHSISVSVFGQDGFL
jgi:hypothetical protein